MIKVLFDYQIFYMQKYGGISRYFANIQSCIAQQNGFQLKTSLLYHNNYYLKNTGVFSNNFGSILFKNKNNINKWNRRYSRLCLRANNFDVFHPTYYDPYFLPYLKKPFVLTVHDMIHELFPENFLASDVYSGYKKLCINKADHIIAISETTKKDLQKFFDIADDKITVIHHGINSEQPVTEQVDGLPSQYLLFVGQRSGYKNFKVLAKAFISIAQQHGDMHLVLAGGGKLSPAEEKFITSNSLEGRIHQITATDEQLNTLYQKAACFIFPSLYEGFGLPILEAFTNGCPMIVSDIACFREIAEDSVAYFNPSDATKLVQSVNQLLESATLKNSLINGGYKQLKKFPLELANEKTLNIYKMLSQSL